MVVSENALFREGLQRLATESPDVTVLGAVASLDEALQIGRQNPPDVVIVDQDKQTPAGLETLAQLLDLAVDRVVTVTLDDPDATVYSRRRLTETSAKKLLDLLSGKA